MAQSLRLVARIFLAKTYLSQCTNLIEYGRHSNKRERYMPEYSELANDGDPLYYGDLVLPIQCCSG